MSSSFCFREEPFQESLCFGHRQVLEAVSSTLMESLDEASGCSTGGGNVPLEFKRFSMTAKDDHAKKCINEASMRDTTAASSGMHPNSPSLDANIHSLGEDQTDFAAIGNQRDRGNLKRELGRFGPRRRSSERTSERTSTCSSSSVVKLKTLRGAMESGSSIFSPNKGSKSGILCRRLDECAHFHYEVVELKDIELSLVEDNFEDDFQDKWLVMEVFSKDKQWKVRRSYQSLHQMDKQLHDCIFKRKFSLLPELTENLVDEEGHIRARAKVCTYFDRLTTLPVSRINCGPVLCWMEMDNRGNRVILPDSDSAINIPAVAAAHSIKPYTAQSTDELTLKVGDILSIIDKPPSTESIWWRGKKEFEVGFFPSECVELLDSEKIPQSIASRCSVNTHLKHTSSIGRKNKLKSLLMSFFSTRPNRSSLKRSGIVKERLFACDLGEHLLNSDEEVPAILKCCSEVLEVHGIVDGIYRLSGAASTINKLRNEFDEGRIPDMTSETYTQDIHSVSSLLKMYFRELPNPLLTYELYDKFIEAITGKEDVVRLCKICDVIKQLPPPHYRTAEYLFRHLNKMASKNDITSMHCKNLAIVWAPNLLRSKELEQMKCGTAALRGVGIQAVVTEFLIKNVCFIFNEENQGNEGGVFMDANRLKSNSPIPTTQKLLTLEEAQERKSQLVSTHLRQKNFIEVGGGAAGLPIKYHTIINLPRDKKKLREKLPSPSRFKTLFRRSQSTSFKENSSEVLKSTSAREKKTSSVGAEVPLKVECSGNKRNLSTSALLSNGTPAGDASFGILDDFKRLSTSCEIPAEQKEKQNKIKSKKLKSKHRSTSVDVASSEVSMLLIELDDNKSEEDLECKRTTVPVTEKISVKKKALPVHQQSPAFDAGRPTNLKEKSTKGKKSKSLKKSENLSQKGDTLKALEMKSPKELAAIGISNGSGSCLVVTADEGALDETQLDKPVLASDESDFKSDSLETFEILYADDLHLGADDDISKNALQNPNVISENDRVITTDKFDGDIKMANLATEIQENVDEKLSLKKAICDDQELKKCSSSDLLDWSLSSDVNSKDLYKELSPTFNDIWMGKGYSGDYVGEDDTPGISVTVKQATVKQLELIETLVPQPVPGVVVLEKFASASDVLIIKDPVDLMDKACIQLLPVQMEMQDDKDDLKSSVTEEDLAQNMSNFQVALNILEQSCDLPSETSTGSQGLFTSPIEQKTAKECETSVFYPTDNPRSEKQKVNKGNTQHCLSKDSTKVRPSTTSCIPSSDQNDSVEVLSDAALDLFSFERMYSSESLCRARLQVSNDDGYVCASYKDLFVKPSKEADFTSSSPDRTLASAPVMSPTDESEIMKRIASYGTGGERTVMMPVGNAARKSQSPQCIGRVQNSMTEGHPSDQVDESFHKKMRHACSSSASSYSFSSISQAATDPLRRRETILSSPTSNSSKDSHQERTEFLFRPSSERSSAFRNHHHRHSARHFNTPSPEMFHSSVVNLSFVAPPSMADFHGNSGKYLTNRDSITRQNQSTNAEVSKTLSTDTTFSRHQPPNVIILNRPLSTIKDETQQKYVAFRPQTHHSIPYPTKLNEHSWQQKSSLDPSRAPSQVQTPRLGPTDAVAYIGRKSISGANTPSGRQPSDVQFSRSISLDENNEMGDMEESTNYKKHIGSYHHHSVGQSRMPFERSEIHSTMDEKSEHAKFSSTHRCVGDAQPLLTSSHNKSSQLTNHSSITTPPYLRANQNFVLAKKQLFESNTNC